jgi:predicted AlkP superfamily phosphohydrolase/phosphomutase
MKKAMLILALAGCIGFVVFSLALHKKKTRVLMIGLDGASWRIIMPMFEQGKLPNMRHLVDHGCWGKIRTLWPTKSDVIWTTVITGKPPKTHGIVDSLMADPSTNELIPATSDMRKVKALWNILSEHRNLVGVVSYRVGWPAEKVNGIMISNRIKKTAYNSALYAQPPFSSFCTKETFADFSRDSLKLELRKDMLWFLNHDNFMANAAEYLYGNNKFDFFCFYLEGIDRVSHLCWNSMCHNKQAGPAEETAKYKDVIPDYYIWCDKVIGDLLRSADKNTVVIVLSDHGFRTSTLQEQPNIFSKIDALLEAAGIKKFNYNSKEIILLNAQEEKPQEFRKHVRISGDISAAELDSVRESVKNTLAGITIKENCRHLFKILDNTRGGFTFEMDELYAFHAEEYHILIGEKEYALSDFFTQDTEFGEHDETDAILIVSGKNIRQQQRLVGASVYDVAPTVLYLLGLPVAKDMPGNVLTGAIDSGFLEEEPVRYIDTYERKEKKLFPRSVRSPEEEEIIKERMRSLGYIK